MKNNFKAGFFKNPLFIIILLLLLIILILVIYHFKITIDRKSVLEKFAATRPSRATSVPGCTQDLTENKIIFNCDKSNGKYLATKGVLCPKNYTKSGKYCIPPVSVPKVTSISSA